MSESQLSSAVDLGSRPWPSLHGPQLVLLVPVGSCEQHGPHLPLDTDTRVAVALAAAAARRVGSCTVSPPVSIGASGEHRSFPGTLSIGTEVLVSVLVEIARSALPPDGSGPFRHVVFVNGHGGNAPAVATAAAQARNESRSVSAWHPRPVGGDAHAGMTETSLILHLSPDVVGPERPVGDTRPLAEIVDVLTDVGVSGVSANGVLGDARAASAEHGASVFEALVADLVSVVELLGLG